MNQEKKYWKSEIELKPNSAIDQLRNNEFTEKLPVDENIFTNDSINNAKTDMQKISTIFCIKIAGLITKVPNVQPIANKSLFITSSFLIMYTV